MNQTSQGGVSAPQKKRYGCFPARIHAAFNHKLEKNLTLPSGRFLKEGTNVYLDVADITRHPEVEGHVEYVCKHPECKGKRWKSTAELIQSHPVNRDLEKAEEAHCFYGVAWLPGVEAKAAKLGKDGAIIEPEVKSELPRILLVSDEE